MSDDKAFTGACTDCGNEFYLKQKDLEFYKTQNFAMPKRCWACRQKRKTRSAERVKAADAGSTENS